MRLTRRRDANDVLDRGRHGDHGLLLLPCGLYDRKLGARRSNLRSSRLATGVNHPEPEDEYVHNVYLREHVVPFEGAVRADDAEVDETNDSQDRVAVKAAPVRAHQYKSLKPRNARDNRRQHQPNDGVLHSLIIRPVRHRRRDHQKNHHQNLGDDSISQSNVMQTEGRSTIKPRLCVLRIRHGSKRQTLAKKLEPKRSTQTRATTARELHTGS